ncbi:MAG: DNA primase [Solirubrobacteraceae bacterium]
MSRYTSDSRDRVRDAVDMLALVESRTELRRAGSDSYFGRCPFHEERTGSFHVRPDAKHYYCFGCQASGDPFTFVMETEGLDFKGALESLADRFGVRLETEDEDPEAAERHARRERLYSLMARTAVYYSRYLWDAAEAAGARDYLLGRGFAAEILREFRVGYAPSAWDRMLLASRKAGFSEAELHTAGLVQRSRTGQVYDRFRGRIMFPTSDARGRVRGFGARAMRPNQQPKYLNTSDGELYHKREVLYGIELARTSAARAGRMILVEGYTDVLALHQAGLRNTVGIMGTSLTEEQVRELERTVGVLELCLDADRAGQEAMVRAARLASGSKLELRVVPLPDGRDPGDLIATDGAEALAALVAGSRPFVAFAIERALGRAALGTAEGRDHAYAEVQPLLAELGPSAVREELVRKVAGMLGLSEARLAALLADGATLLQAAADRAPRRAGSGLRTAALAQSVRSERTLLTLCVAAPDAGADLLARIDPDELLTDDVLRRAARHLAGRTRAPLADLPPGDEPLARVVADLVARAGRAGPLGAERLEHAHLVLERERLSRAILRARATGSPGISELAHERERVAEQIRAVVGRLESTV